LNADGAGGIRGTRTEGERGVTATRVLKGANELSWTVFENTRDLLGDLLGAKNAGVTRTVGAWMALVSVSLIYALNLEAP
jgi:exosortase/archaeosortase